MESKRAGKKAYFSANVYRYKRKITSITKNVGHPCRLLQSIKIGSSFMEEQPILSDHVLRRRARHVQSKRSTVSLRAKEATQHKIAAQLASLSVNFSGVEQRSIRRHRIWGNCQMNYHFCEYPLPFCSLRPPGTVLVTEGSSSSSCLDIFRPSCNL